jgi:hypothetical protein
LRIERLHYRFEYLLFFQLTKRPVSIRLRCVKFFRVALYRFVPFIWGIDPKKERNVAILQCINPLGEFAMNYRRLFLTLLITILILPNSASAILKDRASISNHNILAVDEYHPNLKIDFDEKAVVGSVIYKFREYKGIGDNFVILDSKNVNVVKVAVDIGNDRDPVEFDGELISEDGTIYAPLPFEWPPDQNGLFIEDPFEPCAEFTLKVWIDYPEEGQTTGINWSAPSNSRNPDTNMQYPAAYTQLESVISRELFPNQDTPQSDARFITTLTVPEDLVAFANSDEALGEELHLNGKLPGWRQVRYETSFEIPLYLYCIFVGRMDVTEIRAEDLDLSDHTPGQQERFFNDTATTEIYTISEPETHENAITMAKELPSMIAYIEEYFGIKFTAPSLRWAWTPKGYTYGGMGNHGLILGNGNYIDSDLTGGNWLHYSVVDLMSHEVAHHWTGNHLTTNDWVSLWVNEGTTSYIERLYLEDHGHRLVAKGLIDLAVSATSTEGLLEKEWQDKKYQSFGYAFNDKRHPIGNLLVEPRAYDTSDVAGFGDNYAKGVWVFRELQHLIGRDGVRYVLRQIVPDNDEPRRLMTADAYLLAIVDHASDYVSSRRKAGKSIMPADDVFWNSGPDVEIAQAPEFGFIMDMVRVSGQPVIQVSCERAASESGDDEEITPITKIRLEQNGVPAGKRTVTASLAGRLSSDFSNHVFRYQLGDLEYRTFPDGEYRWAGSDIWLEAEEVVGEIVPPEGTMGFMLDPRGGRFVQTFHHNCLSKELLQDVTLIDRADVRIANERIVLKGTSPEELAKDRKSLARKVGRKVKGKEKIIAQMQDALANGTPGKELKKYLEAGIKTLQEEITELNASAGIQTDTAAGGE